MKKLMIGLALTAMAATPSLAQSYPAGYYHSGTASGPQAGDNVIVTGSTARSAYDAYAYAPGAGTSSYAYVMPDPGAVYVNGEYQGADPDPNVRLQLMRDPPTLQQ